MECLSGGSWFRSIWVAFVLAVTKYLIESNLGKEGVILAHSIGGTQFTAARKV